MSAIAAVLLLATTATTLPPAQAPRPAPPVREVDRTPIRCRPAPYYVSDPGGGPEFRGRVERILITGSRIPVHKVEKRPRPCLLMRTMDEPSHNVARIAD